MTDDSEAFKIRLRKQIRERRLSLGRFAALMGVSVRTVNRWLADGLDHGYVPILHIGRALKCSGSWLTGQRDSPEMPVFLTADEEVMLRLYRRLNSLERAAVISTVEEAHGAMEKERNRC